MYWGYTKKNTRFYTWGYVERKYLHKQEKRICQKSALHDFCYVWSFSSFFSYFFLCVWMLQGHQMTLVFFLWKRIENKKRQGIFKSSFWNIKETGWVHFTTHNNLTTNMGQNIKGQGLTSNNSNNNIILLPGKNL